MYFYRQGRVGEWSEFVLCPEKREKSAPMQGGPIKPKPLRCCDDGNSNQDCRELLNIVYNSNLQRKALYCIGSANKMNLYIS